jgi:hypothetical protein
VPDARDIIQNGIKAGNFKAAMGPGFYTFPDEQYAIGWASPRAMPAVVRLGMPLSLYKKLKAAKLAEEGPWIAILGANPTPGITQIVFRAASFPQLNTDPRVTREWRWADFAAGRWTNYTSKA